MSVRYQHQPTTAEIADHLDAGGRIERQSKPGAPWGGWPECADRRWREFPDQSERWTTYRLVHNP